MNLDDLRRGWRPAVSAPEYAALLRELDDLGVRFEWREDAHDVRFVALCAGEVVGEQRLDAHASSELVVQDVLNQAADRMEVLS